MQNYISKELFHFIGKNLLESEQYDRFKKILSDCQLGFGEKGSILTEGEPSRKLSSNEIYTGEMVCFCDIPLNELQIHIRKYSRFGISFHKQYLLPKGASPIWYISSKSNIDSESKKTNDTFYDKMHERFTALFEYIETQIDLEKDKKLLSFFNSSRSLFDHFESRIFPFMKFFDVEKIDADKENYYMEREWRIEGRLNFKDLNNIYRIILPKSYIQKFRIDFPKYNGQISFAE